MKETAPIRQPLRMGLLVAVLAGVLGTAVWTWQGLRPRRVGWEDRPLEGLKTFGTVPAFALIERGGRRVTLADLRGKVWIANFIYTHCTDTCPLQSAQMARLQADLQAEPDIRLVSITVDPEQDKPQVLAAYATRFGADRERWLFLTGEKRAIYALALEGFRLSVADPEETDQRAPVQSVPADRSAAPGVSLFAPVPAMAHPGHPGKPFIHSSRFALVDRQARIRGYYQSNDNEALQRLRRDVKLLLQEDRP